MQEVKYGGIIHLDVSNVPDLQSPVNWFNNLPWRLMVRFETDSSSKGPYLYYRAYCCEEGNEEMSCEATIVLNLLSQSMGETTYSRTLHVTQKEGRASSDIIKLNWFDVVDNGLARKDGGIEIEATISVKNVIGVPITSIRDFTSPQGITTDVILIVEGRHLHVGKQYLSMYSPFFCAMFSSDFEEKEKKEIPLGDDIKYDEFVTLLSVIYPSRKAVTASNVECLLRLGDHFIMEVVLRECEQFLSAAPDRDEFKFMQKLLWADQYRLSSLQFVCLESIKTVGGVKALTETMEFRQLSDKAKAALFERSLMLG